MSITFSSPAKNKKELEQAGPFTPKFDENGLISAIAIDATDNTVLMLAYMNAEALSLTIETGIAHYYSRSRQQLWKKGETSGNFQEVRDILVDCDQDALVLKVNMTGESVACHTGRKSCFFRKVEGLNSNKPVLAMDENT